MKEALKKRPVIICLIVVAAFAFLVIATVLGINGWIMITTAGNVMNVETVAASDMEFDCILVLGAGVRANGQPSPMLEDRLKTAISLYENGASDRFLMSGDHMSEDYDEVGTMKRYAMEKGIAGEVIFLDHAGLSTYESMWRAKEIFGAKRVLIVTQGYHLYRAIYIAEFLGLEAYGVPADLRTYQKMPIFQVREMAARVKDFLCAIAKPTPANVGEAVDLSGDGNSTNVNKFFDEE